MNIIVPADRLAKAVVKHFLPAAQRRLERLQAEKEQKKTS